MRTAVTVQRGRRVGQDPQSRPGQPRAARRLVRARLGAAPLHVPGECRRGAGRDGHRQRGRGVRRVSVFAWNQRSPCSERPGDDRRDGRRRLPVDPLGNIRASMIYPCRYQLLGPAAGRDRARRRPQRTARVGHAHERRGRAGRPRRHVLKSAPQSYHFEPGSVDRQPGGSLVIRVLGDSVERHPS